MILLDTCSLLWLAQGSKKLSAACRRRISHSPGVLISAITAFEIAIKVRFGKLELPALPGEWLETVLEHHDISVVPLDQRICIAAAELPDIHRDPCDRFIIATARLNHWPIATQDRRFEQYGVEVVG